MASGHKDTQFYQFFLPGNHQGGTWSDPYMFRQEIINAANGDIIIGVQRNYGKVGLDCLAEEFSAWVGKIYPFHGMEKKWMMGEQQLATGSTGRVDRFLSRIKRNHNPGSRGHVASYL